jgi:hypothetical protein
MAGVWLVPRRAWQLVVQRRIGAQLRRNSRSATASVAVLATIAVSVYVASDAMPRVFRCLWEGWCTATRGGGLLNLALFGATVALVEATWAGCSALMRRSSGEAG